MPLYIFYMISCDCTQRTRIGCCVSWTCRQGLLVLYGQCAILLVVALFRISRSSEVHSIVTSNNLHR